VCVCGGMLRFVFSRLRERPFEQERDDSRDRERERESERVCVCAWYIEVYIFSRMRKRHFGRE